MDQEEKKLLEENLKLSKENNELLHKVRNMLRWAQITRILYWVVIIGISYGAFYFLKPFLGNFTNLYSGGVSGIGNVTDLTKNLQESHRDFQDLFN